MNLRKTLDGTFSESNGSYGYRRIHLDIKLLIKRCFMEAHGMVLQ